MNKRFQLDTDKENLPTVKSRFVFDTDDQDFEDYKRGFVPKNTLGDTQKCTKLFEDWKRGMRNALTILSLMTFLFPETKVYCAIGSVNSPLKYERRTAAYTHRGPSIITLLVSNGTSGQKRNWRSTS